jgi:hypothetical protein
MGINESNEQAVETKLAKRRGNRRSLAATT